MKSLITILLLSVPGQWVIGQENQTIQDGNNYYRQQQYDKAEAEYQKVLQASPRNGIARFNLADAQIRQNNAANASKLLTELNVAGNSADLRSKADYNQGVLFSQQHKLEESIESYKESLRLNPGDQEARENLQKALLELKKKNPPKPNEKKKQQQPQQQQPKPKMSRSEAEQQLKLLEQKERQIQDRLQKSSKTASSQPKDW